MLINLRLRGYESQLLKNGQLHAQNSFVLH